MVKLDFDRTRNRFICFGRVVEKNDLWREWFMERFWMRLVRLFQCVDKSFSTINKSAICTAYVNAIPQLSDLEQLKSMFFALKSPLMIALWAELLMLFRRSLLDSVGCVGMVSSYWFGSTKFWRRSIKIRHRSKYGPGTKKRRGLKFWRESKEKKQQSGFKYLVI